MLNSIRKEEINNNYKVNLDYSKIIKELLKDNVSSKDLLKMIDNISELDKDIKTGLKSIDNAVLAAIISVDK